MVCVQPGGGFEVGVWREYVVLALPGRGRTRVGARAGAGATDAKEMKL